jgi:hypothetical protein
MKIESDHPQPRTHKALGDWLAVLTGGAYRVFSSEYSLCLWQRVRVLVPSIATEALACSRYGGIRLSLPFFKRNRSPRQVTV